MEAAQELLLTLMPPGRRRYIFLFLLQHPEWEDPAYDGSLQSFLLLRSGTGNGAPRVIHKEQRPPHRIILPGMLGDERHYKKFDRDSLLPASDQSST